MSQTAVISAIDGPTRRLLQARSGHADEANTSGAGCGTLRVDPVDLNHLRRYTLGDSALEREVLELFFAQLPVTLAALGAAKTERDWKVAAHTLKGSGRAVGAWRLARIAEQAERTDLLKRPEQLAEALFRLDEAAAEARAFVAAVYR